MRVKHIFVIATLFSYCYDATTNRKKNVKDKTENMRRLSNTTTAEGFRRNAHEFTKRLSVEALFSAVSLQS